MPTRKWSDEWVGVAVGFLLRAGVIIAALIVLTGGTLYVVKYGSDVPDYKIFHGEPAALRATPGIVADALSFHSRGIIQLGLFLLMVTPAVWVAFLALSFARQRDFLYAVIALIVLAVLLFSVSGSSM